MLRFDSRDLKAVETAGGIQIDRRRAFAIHDPQRTVAGAKRKFLSVHQRGIGLNPEEVTRVLRGERPPNVANPEVYASGRLRR